MYISLMDKASQRSDGFYFDPDDPKYQKRWKKQNEAGHIPGGLNTGVRRPFDRVFIKWWKSEKAPAHGLLKTICGTKLPATPQVFGIESCGAGVLYVYELVAGNTLDNVVMQSTNLRDTLTADLMVKVIDQASRCFEALEGRSYIYTDFAMKNLMYGPQGEVVVIDLDSAWSVSHFLSNWNNPLVNNKFSKYFWILWSDYIVGQRSVTPATAALLPKTMILTFAAVMGRALGQLRLSQPPSTNEIEALVRHPKIDVQKLLWDALGKPDKGEFYKYFNIHPSSSANVQNMFEEWRDIFRELVAGRFVAWRDIRKATTDLAACYQPQISVPQKKPGRVMPPPTPRPATSPPSAPTYFTPPVILTPPVTFGGNTPSGGGWNIGIPPTTNPPPPPQALTPPPKHPVVRKALWDIVEGTLHGAIDPLGILKRNGKLKRKSPYR